jgi:poly-gamma-glutamate synthesis protein (capsule biosynthesis protein)
LLDRRDIATVGGGFDREDAEHVKIIEKEGIKIGFVGFSDVGPRWMEADDDLSGILLVDDDFEDIIKRGASQVDYLVVSLHFGNEYEAEASERQKKLARLAIDAGAKIIVGHHPHVIQEVERYKDGVIAYSLGNFIFDQNFSEETMKGLILKISANEDKITNVETIATKLNENFQPELITP